jgi:muramidase (phage lysozyme)
MSEDRFAPARGLMELVGDKESNGDYNVAYGGTKDNFTNMTIDEVLQWQDDYVDAGSRSSAIGKYQIIRKTLRDLKKKMKLTGDEVFSPEMQDAMFVELLRKRGYDKWTEGKLSDDEFGNNLAKEWASFPVLTDMKGSKRKVKAGETYYAGDGLNKALISPEEVRGALVSYRTPDPLIERQKQYEKDLEEEMQYAELAGDYDPFAHDPYYEPYGRTNMYRVTTRNGVPVQGAIPDPDWHGDRRMAESYYTDRPFESYPEPEEDPVSTALSQLYWLDKNIK